MAIESEKLSKPKCKINSQNEANLNTTCKHASLMINLMPV